MLGRGFVKQVRKRSAEKEIERGARPITIKERRERKEPYEQGAWSDKGQN